LLDVRLEEERDPIVGKDADGNPTSTPRDPLVKAVTVTATVAGKVATLDVLKDQVVAVGDVVGSLSLGTLSVTAPLTQADQFRLLSPPSTAEVTVTGGPAPFTCTGLSVAIVRNLPLERWLGGGIPLADAPGFPVSAAVQGLIAATAVGALAGLVPALIAVRVKVIDAIRF
jgi:hypothetical protein